MDILEVIEMVQENFNYTRDEIMQIPVYSLLDLHFYLLEVDIRDDNVTGIYKY